jgi:hypothetical protein
MKPVGGKEVALRLTGFVYQIVFMEYNMTQRGKDRGSWPELKRQSDAIVQAFAKFMCAASVKSGGGSARSLHRRLRHRSDMRRREIVLRVRLSAKKVFHPQAWRVRSVGGAFVRK